jgi:hypothetical protein
MKITIYTSLLDLNKIANEDYEGVQWSVFNSRQIIRGVPNVEIHIDYETYIRLKDTTSESKNIIQG